MRKHLISLIMLVLLLPLGAMAQDQLLFLNGDEETVKIMEVTTDELKYKRWDNMDGPLFTVRKADLFMVKYANGTKEKFEAKAAAPASAARVPMDYSESERWVAEIRHKNHKYGDIMQEQTRLCRNKINQGITVAALGGGLFWPVGIYYLWSGAVQRTSLPQVDVAFGALCVAAGSTMIAVGSVRIGKFIRYRNYLNTKAGQAYVTPVLLNSQQYQGTSVMNSPGYGVSVGIRF